MFVVPEVDDDADVSTPVNTTKSITEAETTKEPLLQMSHSSSIEVKPDKKEAKMQVQPPPAPPAAPAATTTSSQPSLAPAPTKQHRSRRSLFHRNTIHICDQIGDRM